MSVFPPDPEETLAHFNRLMRELRPEGAKRLYRLPLESVAGKIRRQLLLVRTLFSSIRIHARSEQLMCCPEAL